MCSGAACSKCCTEGVAQKCSYWNETTGGSYNCLTQQWQIRIESRAASQSRFFQSLKCVEFWWSLIVHVVSMEIMTNLQPLCHLLGPQWDLISSSLIAIDPGEIKPAFLWNSIRIYSQKSVGPKQSYLYVVKLPGRCSSPKGSHSKKFLYKNGMKRTHLGWFWIWKPP